MKNIIISLLSLTFILGSFNFGQAEGNLNNGNAPAAAPGSINNFDSVYFDISQAIFIGNSVEVPVYFRSDDIINAIGFAFSFDETVLEYDTMLVVAPYFDSPIFSYNQIDSVVRFEAFSITQPMVNDTVLIKVRFNLLTTQLCDTQIDSIWTSLNGDVCSNAVEGCQTLGLNDSNFDNNIKLYPNPANDIFYIDAPNVKFVELYDVEGKLVMNKTIEDSGRTIQLPVKEFNSGIYFVKLFSDKTILTSKIILNK